jgi:tetratricopeptide (TPR) repeat protein
MRRSFYKWPVLAVAALALTPAAVSAQSQSTPQGPLPAASRAATFSPSQRAALDTAKALFNTGHYQEAKDVLLKEVYKPPTQALLYYWIARCAFELQDHDQAVNFAEKSVELEPKDGAYHHFLGRAYGHKAEHANWFSGLGLARKASHEFSVAVELEPTNIRFQRDLIAFYIQAPGIAGGGEDKALEQITQLFAVSPVQGHLARLEFNENRKKWSQAEDEVKNVLAAKPKDAGPYLEIAEYYENRSDATGIRTALAAIPKDAPADARVNFYRGVADVLAGDHPDEAESSLKAYLANLPQRREEHASRSVTHVWLGRLYERQGKKETAVSEYRLALELDPNEKGAHEGLRRLGA